MIYFKSRSGRDDVMAILIVEEEVIWHERQSSSAAESEPGKGFGQFYSRLTARGGNVCNSQMTCSFKTIYLIDLPTITSPAQIAF